MSNTIVPISRARRLERLEAKPPNDGLGLGKPLSEMTPSEKAQAVRHLRAQHGPDPELDEWLATLTPREKAEALIEIRKIIRDMTLSYWQKQEAAYALMARPGSKLTSKE